jgi:putative restriction endonuclease
MYSSALNHYGNYLKNNHINSGIFFEENHSFTSEAERMIKVRLLQNRFRKSLFDLNQCCAVSGFKNSEFLIASHIKPWSKSSELERIDPYNGFLLTPTYDRLFDRGFITFTPIGEILISKQLRSEDLHFFNIPKKLFFKPLERHHCYLEFHRDEVFKK